MNPFVSAATFPALFQSVLVHDDRDLSWRTCSYPIYSVPSINSCNYKDGSICLFAGGGGVPRYRRLFSLIGINPAVTLPGNFPFFWFLPFRRSLRVSPPAAARARRGHPGARLPFHPFPKNVKIGSVCQKSACPPPGIEAPFFPEREYRPPQPSYSVDLT